MLNRILLQGRLVADPELRHTQTDTAVASFRLAVDRDYKDKGTNARQADFINVVAWRQTAEFAAQYFSKGQMAIVEGKLQVRAYTDRDGNKRTATEVLAEHIYFCGSKAEGQSTRPAGSYQPPASSASIPDAAYRYDPNNPSAFESMTDDDGELPF